MPTTSPNNIAYDEINWSDHRRSPKEEWRPDGTFVAKRILQCAYADRYLLISDIGASGGENYPNLPQIGATASGAVAIGIGQSFLSGAVLVHDFAWVDITYIWSPFTPTWVAGVLVSEKITGGMFNLRLDPEKLLWSDTNENIDETDAPDFPLPVLYYQLKLHQITAESPLVYSLVGSSNANIVTPYLLNYSFQIETLMYSSVTVNKSVGLGITDKMDVTQNFIFKRNGWNRWYRSKTNSWERVKYADTGTQVTPHPLVNF